MDDQSVENLHYRVGVVFEVNKNIRNLQNHHVGVLLDDSVKSRSQKLGHVTTDNVRTFQEVDLSEYDNIRLTRSDPDDDGLKWSKDDYAELKDEDITPYSSHYSQVVSEPSYTEEPDFIDAERVYADISNQRKLRESFNQVEESEDIYLNPVIQSEQELSTFNDSGGVYDVTGIQLPSVEETAFGKPVTLSDVNFINKVEGHTDGTNIILKEDKLEPKTRFVRIGSNRNYRKKPRIRFGKKKSRASFRTIDEGYYKTFYIGPAPSSSTTSLDSLGQDLHDYTDYSDGTITPVQDEIYDTKDTNLPVPLHEETKSFLTTETSQRNGLVLDDECVHAYREGLVITADRKLSYRVGLVVGDKMKSGEPATTAKKVGRDDDESYKIDKSVLKDQGLNSVLKDRELNSVWKDRELNSVWKDRELNSVLKDQELNSVWKDQELNSILKDQERNSYYKFDDRVDSDISEPTTEIVNGYSYSEIELTDKGKGPGPPHDFEEVNSLVTSPADTDDEISLRGRLHSQSDAGGTSNDEGLGDSIELLPTSPTLQELPVKDGVVAEEVTLIEAKLRTKSIRGKPKAQSLGKAANLKETEPVVISNYLGGKILEPSAGRNMMEEKGEFDKFEWETHKAGGIKSPEASGGYSPVKSPISPEDNRHKIYMNKKTIVQPKFVIEQKPKRASLESFHMSREVETHVVDGAYKTNAPEDRVETFEEPITPEAATESQRPPSVAQPPSVFRVLLQKEAIVGLPSEVTLEVKDAQRDVRLDEIQIIPDAESVRFVDRTSLVSYNNRLRRLKLRFIPLDAGPCSLKVGSIKGSFPDETISVEAGGNNPLLSFSEGDEYPLNVACGLNEPTIYVSYIHHISKFNQEGEFLRDIVHDKEVYFNDLAVDECSYVAACVSNWDEEVKKKRSNQEVRLYDLFGTLLWKVGTPPSMNSEAVCHVAFDWHGNVLFSTRRNLCRCSRLIGDLDICHKVPGLQMVNRLAISPQGELIVLDGVSRKLIILDKTLNFLRNIDLEPTNGALENSGDTKECGYSGLCVDKVGNIVVSDCRRETVDIYRPDGTRLGWLESEWDSVKWPLSVAVSRSGFLFVVDHRNGCVKKFRYLP